MTEEVDNKLIEKLKEELLEELKNDRDKELLKEIEDMAKLLKKGEKDARKD